MFIWGPPAVGSRPGEGGGGVAAPGDAPGDHDEHGGDDHDEHDGDDHNKDGGDDHDEHGGDDHDEDGGDSSTSTILHIIN